MTTPRERLAKLIFFTDNRLIPTPEIEKGWKEDDNAPTPSPTQSSKRGGDHP